MSGRVPRARRSLLAERWRLAMSLWEWAPRSPWYSFSKACGRALANRTRQDNVGAELYVGERGTENFTDTRACPSNSRPKSDLRGTWTTLSR